MRPLTLRTRFVLILVLGAVLPMGVVGYWLARSAERSGRQLLAQRLDETLGGIADEISSRWVEHRSHLSDLAEHEGVQAALSGTMDAPQPPPESLRSVYARYDEDLPLVSAVDVEGRERVRLEPESPRGLFGRGPTTVIEVSIGVYSRSGERRGTLEAMLRWESLLAGGTEWAGAPGSMLTVLDQATGFAVRSSGIDANLVRSPRFEWEGEPWISRTRTIREPPLELVLAAPLAPLTQPFADATRRGLYAVIVIGLLSLVLATLATSRVTRSLSRLASSTDAVAKGDLQQKVPEGGGRELGRVAAAFNTMIDSLRSTLGELARQRSVAAVGEFAASLAHEVRNPLSSIRVDLELAEEGWDQGRAREFVGRALRTVDRLEETVTGALRIARSGHIDRQELDLRTVLQAAKHGAGPELARHGAVWVEGASAAQPLTMNGDPSALEQVFLNLLLNAAQASEPGGAVRLDASAGSEFIEVSVMDEGRGIEPDHRDQVFDPFFTTRDGGSGLGLAVVDRIVSAHGGSVSVRSDVGKGTRVTVRLPRALRALFPTDRGDLQLE